MFGFSEHKNASLFSSCAKKVQAHINLPQPLHDPAHLRSCGKTSLNSNMDCATGARGLSQGRFSCPSGFSNTRSSAICQALRYLWLFSVQRDLTTAQIIQGEAGHYFPVTTKIREADRFCSAEGHWQLSLLWAQVMGFSIWRGVTPPITRWQIHLQGQKGVILSPVKWVHLYLGVINTTTSLTPHAMTNAQV